MKRKNAEDFYKFCVAKMWELCNIFPKLCNILFRNTKTFVFKELYNLNYQI